MVWSLRLYTWLCFLQCFANLVLQGKGYAVIKILPVSLTPRGSGLCERPIECRGGLNILHVQLFASEGENTTEFSVVECLELSVFLMH